MAGEMATCGPQSSTDMSVCSLTRLVTTRAAESRHSAVERRHPSPDPAARLAASAGAAAVDAAAERNLVSFDRNLRTLLDPIAAAVACQAKPGAQNRGRAATIIVASSIFDGVCGQRRADVALGVLICAALDAGRARGVRLLVHLWRSRGDTCQYEQRCGRNTWQTEGRRCARRSPPRSPCSCCTGRCPLQDDWFRTCGGQEVTRVSLWVGVGVIRGKQSRAVLLPLPVSGRLVPYLLPLDLPTAQRLQLPDPSCVKPAMHS